MGRIRQGFWSLGLSSLLNRFWHLAHLFSADVANAPGLCFDGSVWHEWRHCLTKTAEQAYQFINNYAPEHCQILSKQPDQHLAKITTASEILLGEYAAGSLANYMMGPNCVLPTSGARTHSRLVCEISCAQLLLEGSQLKASQRWLQKLKFLPAMKGLMHMRMRCHRYVESSWKMRHKFGFKVSSI